MQIKNAPLPAIGEWLPAPFGGDIVQLGMLCHTHLTDDRQGFLSLWRHHRQAVWLDDPSLLTGDLRDRVAKHFGMVETDRGDDRDQWCGDIGRV
jgi:hypothetical protein